MGFNAVADHIKKWKKSSNQHDIVATTTTTTTTTTPTATAPGSTNASTVTAATTHNPNNKKLRKPPSPPSKQYPPSPDSFLQGIGDYTFVKQIGQGKFSRVMLSTHCLTQKQVAVKIIDKRVHDYRVISRLVREISLMEALDHPNIVRLYETYETTDSMYLVMEYVEGYNLDEYLQQRGGKLPETEARDIFRQMAAAMDYCHSRWVVHRDLKAPNILLTKDFQVKIADFGLGNRYGRRRLKTICGSMLYYSPEIINGQGYTGPEVDCWCLGVSLYRMTVGEEPFNKANTVGDLRKDVTGGNFIIPSYLSAELKNTILKCMSVDRNKRSRVHLALRNDAWLFDNGKLPDVFTFGIASAASAAATAQTSTAASRDDEIARLKREKEQLMNQHLRDMEQEKTLKKAISRTIVCHPKNPSIYFTSVIPHSSKPEDTYTNSEKQRHLLFQKVNEMSHQIQLSPAQNAGSKSPIRHLLRKLKQPDSHIPHSSLGTLSISAADHSVVSAGNSTSNNSSNSSSNSSALLPQQRNPIRKTTSNMSLSQIYQRVAKDQVHYYTFQLTPQTAQHITTAGEEASVPAQQQDEAAMMLIIRGICDIMGITYHRDRSDRLICVMALSDYINEKPRSFYKLRRRDSKLISSSQSLYNDAYHSTAHDGSQASFSRSSAGLSDMNRSSQFVVGGSRFSKLKRMTSHLLSSIFPYHSSTLVVHDSRSVRYPPFPHINAAASNASRLNNTANRTYAGSQSSQQQSSPPHTTASDEDGQDKKSGVAVFAIDILSLSKDPHNRVAAIKLSKLEGSSKVFRIACGWITGVIGQNISPSQLTDQFNSTLMNCALNASADIPTAAAPATIVKKSLSQPRLLNNNRPKSIVTAAAPVVFNTSSVPNSPN
ncbi:hypothetical protein [Parasitella parasitica]|uniref:Protein kinase domain-containing protein n=1 Tax=Parasitella parasitica TaxID=35722 RepID=A0A0B7NWE0_9FUNG|nr:hypothetical protein [Parasitella parasitica]